MNREHWLVKYSRKLMSRTSSAAPDFGLPKEENQLLADIENYPHAFVLACCMSRRVPVERGWSIPWKIKELCQDFTIDTLSSLSLNWYKEAFENNSLHCFNERMAGVFYNAVQRINNEYAGDASRIWTGNPSSASVVYRFLQFEGAGIKIATMAANLLCRQFGVRYSDYYSVEISTDVHVMRLFARTGLVRPSASREEVIYKARELCPEYPGITDYACWTVGREYCFPNNPDCKHCPLFQDCPKHGTKSEGSIFSISLSTEDLVDESIYDPQK